MADINKLTKEEFLLLLNSTKLGKACNEDLIREVKRNSLKFIDKGRFSFLRFIASMVDHRHNDIPVAKKKRDQTTSDDYEKIKEKARKRNAEKSSSGRDIGSIPPVADMIRKESCRYDLRKFMLTYFKEQCFYYELSDAMEVAIVNLQKIILQGGLKALAMPRGSGKTTLEEIATIWAISYGHRKYVVFIGATVKGGLKSLEAIKTAIETNDMYADDFPAISFPIRALEGINIRANGQMCCGERTHISWVGDEAVLPTIEGAETSGIILEATGIEGQIRGRKHTNQAGQNIRPDFFTCDDFQTDESAMNPEQCRKRLAIINKAILGLAGSGKAIAGFVPCTVIQLGDGADQLLDREKYPQFQGTKTRMMISFPDNLELWKQYAEIRNRGFKEEAEGNPSNDFYVANREALDKGCIVYWRDRYDRDTIDSNGKKTVGEISAIQSAMNLFLKDEDSFYSEYQNEPKALIESIAIITPEELRKKLNRVPRLVVPIGCSRLVTYIDVQKACLFYVTMAFEDNFSSSIIDYGTFPEQSKNYFTLKEINKTLEKAYPNMGFEGYLRKGLDELVSILAKREYVNQGGGVTKHNNIMIDANWGASTDTIYEFCRQSAFANILIPSHGMFVGASTAPFSEYKKKKGDRIGDHWRIPAIKGKRAIPYMLIDTNHWKTFVHSRLSTAMGDNGNLSLYGDDEKRHELIADHLCKSEYVIETEGRGRKVAEWKEQLSFKENHFFDCVTGCHVLASFNSVVLGDVSFKNLKKTRNVVSINKPKQQEKESNPPESVQNPFKMAKKSLSLKELQQKPIV